MANIYVNSLNRSIGETGIYISLRAMWKREGGYYSDLNRRRSKSTNKVQWHCGSSRIVGSLGCSCPRNIFSAACRLRVQFSKKTTLNYIAAAASRIITQGRRAFENFLVNKIKSFELV